MPKLRSEADCVLEPEEERLVKIRADKDSVDHITAINLDGEFDDETWRIDMPYHHQRLVEEYCIDRDVIGAVERVTHYRMSLSSARSILKKPRVAAAIYYRTQRASKHLKNKILDELTNIAFHDPREYFEENEEGELRVKKITELTAAQAKALTEIAYANPNSSAAVSKIKWDSRQAALEKLGKILKMFVDKQEISGPDGAPIGLQSLPKPENMSAKQRAALRLLLSDKGD